MMFAEITLGAPHWLAVAIALAVIALAVLLWSYLRRTSSPGFRLVAAILKTVGIAALAMCLVEPLFTGTRPRPGSNLFLVVADNSRSLQLADKGERQSRGERLREDLKEQSPWLARLGQSFDVRRYAFDTSLRPVKTFDELTLDGEASAIGSSLAALGERFRGQPVAGILLLTDGNATDIAETARDWNGLPPVYPVAVGGGAGLLDLAVSRVTVTQTNFDSAPVTITATLEGQSLEGREIGIRLLDDTGKEIERRTVAKIPAGEPLAERFLLRPEQAGISFYTVQTFLQGEEEATEKSGKTAEATLANNRRIATVDRGGGPYRVLYVSGRPNWEYKFLRRAVQEDDEVNLVGLVRVAKKEPKFTFLGRSGERTNPLFRGFGNQADEQAEQYDQPVLIRLNTEDKEELLGGFPKNADDLFRYHAVILDEIEAAFFTQDQLTLLQQFVSRRGGGFLMLGGKESFGGGGYQRTTVGEMLPVYLDRSAESAEKEPNYRLLLTREGWLQPWVRVRSTEDDERKRLAEMPAFKSLTPASSIKPGASVLAQVTSADGTLHPALAVQQFGRGRAGALLIGDLWRWNMRRADSTQSDLDKAWRQTVRWLVSDVPGRVEVETKRIFGSALPAVHIAVRARDKQFEPLDNASVSIQVKTPDDRTIELVAESSDSSPGLYEATFAPRAAGAYRAAVSVKGADGSVVGERDTGWSVEPQTEEFRTLAVNTALLKQIADETGGEVVDQHSLARFVADLPNRKIPITESWTYPLWHQWPVFMLAVCCLVGEWGLRRWKGMP